MGNEIPLTDLNLPTQVHGVIAVTPVFVQPVKIVDNPQPVNIAGTVTIVQPVTIATPIDVHVLAGLAPIAVDVISMPNISFLAEHSTYATVTADPIGTTSVLLLGSNPDRKGFAVQATNQIVFVKLDSVSSTALYSYELPRKGILEVENYCGPVAAVTASGSTIAMVTEKV